MTDTVKENELGAAHEEVRKLQAELNNALFGQPELVEQVLISLLAGGHVLLEGLPGLGKTELVKATAKATGLQSKRIQFTPDLLPGDILGTPILQEQTAGIHFVFQPGPIFANLVLADEINRASPKTQSALLEAMQERRATVAGETHQLPDPFFVLATQNPIELEGTYPLPEAQLDRFLMKLQVHRVPAAVLKQIVQMRSIGTETPVQQVSDPDAIRRLIALGRRIFLPDAVSDYIARLVDATHRGSTKAAEHVRYGASPRAALALAAASRARALLQRRINASFEDVQALAAPILRHRIVLEYSAKLSGQTTDAVVAKILTEISAHPRGVPETLVPSAEARN